jgi:hypothetical protein
MALFAVSFRIHDDASYEERYQSLVDALMLCAAPNKFWDRTTSFFLIENASNSAGLAEAIDQNSLFDESKDLLVVINLSQKGYKVLGKNTDPDIDELMKRR